MSVLMHCEPHLPQIGLTLDVDGCFSCLLQGRQQHADEERDYSNNDKQLDQRECLMSLAHDNSIQMFEALAVWRRATRHATPAADRTLIVEGSGTAASSAKSAY